MIRRLLATLAAVPAVVSAAVAADTPSAPLVTGVEVTSPHILPSPRPEQVLTDLAGRPLSRERVRESLDRVWALGVFATVEVEAVPEPGGVRLRYRVSRHPHLERLDWTGNLGLPAPDLAATARLALGGPADPERLERARSEVLARLKREGYLDATVALDVREHAATNGRAVMVQVAAGEPARVGRVELAGLARADAAALLKALGLAEGALFRERAWRDGRRAVEQGLHEQGFFEARVTALEPAWDRATNRVDLTVQVVEGPLTRVEFSGRNALPEKALRERLTFADGRAVDQVEVAASSDQVARAYRAAGHHFVQVTGTLGGDAAERIVTFDIVEGPLVSVESVTFEGLATLPDSRLREQMQTRPRKLAIPGLPRGLFVEETLSLDMRALRRYLRAEGYAEAEVGPPRMEFSDDRTRVRIMLPVVEGARRMVAAVGVTGNRAVFTEPILETIGLRPGDPWDDVKAEDARGRVEQLYQRRGYRGTAVSLTITETPGAVSATYAITEGELTRVGQVLISGLTVTKPYVVERELQFKPGDPLTAVDLAETRRHLDATRIFDRVDVEPRGVPGAPFRDVEIDVREAKPIRLEFGVGYATEEGFRGFVTLGHDNLFGTGRSIAGRERVSERGDRTELFYREPWIFGTIWAGEAVGFRERKEEIGFVSDRLGTTFTAQRDFLTRFFRPEEPTDHPRSLRGGLRYRFEQFRRSDIDPELLAEGTTERDDLVGSLTPFLSLELRDQPADPRHGSYHFTSFEAGSTGLGGEVNFVKFILEDSWFIGWPPPTVLAISTRLGVAAPYGGTDDLVIEDRFKAGGSTTIRGYREDRVGPLDAIGNPLGGDLRVLVNLEWRFPIWRFLGGVTFFDVGAVTPRVSDFSIGDFFPGIGSGLRITTPIGPIRLDLGYALRKIPDEDRLQVYLTV
ncbi:MAG TPA: POTRA domain-containing protein, partial [Methylomirabilota bacterium]|nr:POTRA domain-containing protein [Methylomirabilota bacterium]